MICTNIRSKCVRTGTTVGTYRHLVFSVLWEFKRLEKRPHSVLRLLDMTLSGELVVQRFTNYLNGHRGKAVLDSLEEGESFILQTSEHILRVTKRHGKAIVKLEHAPMMYE